MIAKRAFDIFAAVSLLLILAPLMFCIALMVAISMGMPVIYRQRRPGRGEISFLLCKFRTMKDMRAPDGSPLPDVQRLTKLGRLLRATSLDELPEFWNVLVGEMSLVGPRPLLEQYLPYYTQRERKRHNVLPGITGLAQVRGRNQASWESRFAHDIWYVENWSFLLDMKILIETLVVVFHRKGVEVDTRSAMLNLDEERMGAI